MTCGINPAPPPDPLGPWPLYRLFGLTNGPTIFNYYFRQGPLKLCIIGGQQSTAMSCGEGAFLDRRLYVGRQPQKPDHGSDYSSIFTYPLGHNFLRKSKPLNEFQVCLALLDRIQLLPLDVFDQGKFEEFFVRHLTDNRRYTAKLSPLRRPPTPFTGDDLVTVVDATNYNRLHNPILADRLCQLLKLKVVKAGTRLLRVWLDEIKVDLVVSWFAYRQNFFAEQGVKPRPSVCLAIFQYLLCKCIIALGPL